ncbi:hypothetical protein CR513_19694, partial [Mucuna pruriens]
MAKPATGLLPLLAAIVIFILLSGTEARCEKAMGEGGALVNRSSAINQNGYCCNDNHIGSCVPGSEDDSHCDSVCRDHSCNKGGHCKIIGKETPNHFCHCLC